MDCNAGRGGVTGPGFSGIQAAIRRLIGCREILFSVKV